MAGAVNGLVAGAMARLEHCHGWKAGTTEPGRLRTERKRMRACKGRRKRGGAILFTLFRPDFALTPSWPDVALTPSGDCVVEAASKAAPVWRLKFVAPPGTRQLTAVASYVDSPPLAAPSPLASTAERTGKGCFP